ncbi:NACHT, LRR and PYD domains-containing protein 12 [Triplophysa tibetana]|uniref:NACHT, LRR and PYD domains-containing protein 12 n=1 Tax=Triplophysa tibetana TaxID=1572043 RepID=A0A5A9NLE5_9TELE|nr:NACHT, LRR and PYD domains-containing protein 12 [Triplophysa tibetana]
MSVFEEREEKRAEQKQSAASSELSCVSMKSNRSIGVPPDLGDEAVTSDPVTACKMSVFEEREEKRAEQKQSAASSEFSCVSMKSNRSIGVPPDLSDEAVTSDLVRKRPTSDLQTNTLLENTKHLQRVKDLHKTIMKKKYERLFEGIKAQENQTLLKRIYTQLYITEGEREGVNEEHEVLHMEKHTTQHSQDTLIYCNDIFNPLHEPEPDQRQKIKIKSVLTKGIAGIGKSVSVQKFILDWAEGTANQDVDFMFVLPFRELNLIGEHHYSLHKLLLDFHPELQDLDSQIYEECKVVLIFDGLDESRIKLMFADHSEKVSDVTDASSLSVLMSNLIKGDLLPSALIWITSRPAAAHQIPSEYITRVTEIQGFNDPQKEEYFRKRISDEHQFNRIMSHIRRARSLHIMCHIPVFCWISSTVLQKILTQHHSEEMPKTLSEMYIHFLLIQMKMKNEKYDPERDPEINREVIVKLSEVAFKQLMKGNVMFYEEDLIECGIDVTDASLYSGICTEIFKEESVFHQRKIYSFIHLSFQEFLAAFFVFYSYLEKNMRSLRSFFYVKENTLPALLESVIIESLRSKTGHLDLFLRFLLGISLESNQRLIQDLLTHTEDTSDTIKRTTVYIKNRVKDDDHLSVERSINLFLCLLEVNDQTLYREILDFVKSKNHSQDKLSPAHCSAIAYMMVMSEEVMDELNLDKFNSSDEGKLRLIPAGMNCRKALLSKCNITDECCESLASVLQSTNSLVELDMSHNKLKDSGVKLISDALKSSHCQLNTLRFVGSDLSDNSCESLASVLQSSNSLRELDLSHNKLKDSGVKLISDGLKSSHCQLHTLRLMCCDLTDEGCESLASVLQSSKSLRELDLSFNDLKDSGVKLISDGLKSSHCQLEKLRLAGCDLTDNSCESLSSVLQSSNSLRELDLSFNNLRNSVKLISDALKSSYCQLNTLKLKGCDLTDECCESLASVLQSSNSLRELDLSFNDLKDSGVKLISDGLKSSHCQLEILRLSFCKVTDEGCGHLASALRSNPSHLRELDLNNNRPGPLGVQLLSERLHDPNCTLNKLKYVC